jgi:hypothetical protein
MNNLEIHQKILEAHDKDLAQAKLDLRAVQTRIEHIATARAQVQTKLQLALSPAAIPPHTPNPDAK